MSLDQGKMPMRMALSNRTHLSKDRLKGCVTPERPIKVITPRENQMKKFVLSGVAVGFATALAATTAWADIRIATVGPITGQCGLTPCPKSTVPTTFRDAISITSIFSPSVTGFPTPEFP